MGNELQDLVSGLRQTVAQLSASVNLESAWTWLDAALSEGPVRDGLAVGVATFVAVMLVGRLVGRRGFDESDVLRERLRDVELQLEAARGEIVAMKRSQTEFQKGDPQVFARALASALAEERVATRQHGPESWLEPIRPALAEAYLAMARGVLGKLNGEQDLNRARMMAWGAKAAQPQRSECSELLARIEEAERLGLFSELSEADALAWRVARQDADTERDAHARGLISRSRGPIGYSLFLSGWEADELNAAALAELSDRDIDVAMAGGAAQDGQTGAAPDGDAARSGDLRATGARVVALTAGSEDQDEDEDVESARAVGAANSGRGRGRTVVVMPRGRGGKVRGRDDAVGDGGADGSEAQPSGTSDREAGLKRLWERRRRPDMLGETHPRTLAARANLGHEAGRLGRHPEAEAIFREVLDAMGGEDASGDNELDVLTVRHNLGVELLRQGKLDEAELEFKAVLGELGSPAGRGRSIPLALAAAHGLGEVWSAHGKHSEAEAAFAAVWRARSEDKAFGPDHPHTLWSRIRMLRAGEEEAAAG